MIQLIISNFSNLMSDVASQIVSSPLNMILTVLIAAIVYIMLPSREEPPPPSARLPPPLEKDMTLAELRTHDGTGPDGRICLAVNSKIFDVTRGKDFYGTGGPYSALAGHDATRALGTFVTDAVKDEYDDVSDLTPAELEEARTWEENFTFKYPLVGKLLGPKATSETAETSEMNASETIKLVETTPEASETIKLVETTPEASETIKLVETTPESSETIKLVETTQEASKEIKLVETSETKTNETKDTSEPKATKTPETKDDSKGEMDEPKKTNENN